MYRYVPIQTNLETLDVITDAQRESLHRLINRSDVNSAIVSRSFDLPDGYLLFTLSGAGINNPERFKTIDSPHHILTGGIAPDGDVST